MSDDRRTNDALRILIDGINEKLATHSKKISDIEEEIWGYPKGKGLGLLQKVRDSNKKWTAIWAICIFIFGILGRVGGSLLDKFVADWVYNSPSEKYMRESQRPRVKNYKIYVKREADPSKDIPPSSP